MATQRSHAARFGISFSLAMVSFISFAPELYRTGALGQRLIFCDPAAKERKDRKEFKPLMNADSQG